RCCCSCRGGDYAECLLEPRKQKPDIQQNHDCKTNAQHFLKSASLHNQTSNATRGKHAVKCEIRAIRQLTGKHQVLEHTHNNRRKKEKEEPAMMMIEVSAKIRFDFIHLLRQHHRRHDVQRRCLQQHHAEIDKRPLLTQSQSVHRPPHLHLNQHHYRRP